MGEVVTVVIYGDEADAEAAGIIADAFGFDALLITSDVADPLTQYTEENVIAVGGTYPNLWTRYYSCGSLEDPSVACPRIWDSLENPGVFPDNPERWKYRRSWRPGISPDQKRHIETVVRENGTTVTIVAGVHREDTLEAARRFSKPKLNAILALIPDAIAGGIGWYLGRG